MVILEGKLYSNGVINMSHLSRFFLGGLEDATTQGALTTLLNCLLPAAKYSKKIKNI